MRQSLNQLCLLLFTFIMASGCKKSPVAAFTVDKVSAETGIEITFTNSSTDSDSYSWDFGDGETSSQPSPTHSYSEPGSFNVTLTASGNGETSTAVQQIDIFNVVPGVKIGNFKLGNNLDQHVSFLTETQFQHAYLQISEDFYLHLLLFPGTGIGLLWISNDLNVYAEDVPEAIYIMAPYKSRTEKKISLGSLLADVHAAYGLPEKIESDGSYSYTEKLGISFWADESKTKVESIFIIAPGSKSSGKEIFRLYEHLLRQVSETNCSEIGDIAEFGHIDHPEAILSK